jgi:hypothetical protein
MKKLFPALLLSILCTAAAFPADSPEPVALRFSLAAGSPAPASERGSRRPPKTWRAFVEEAVLLTASTIDYWGSYDNFTIDWQFTWKTFGRKLFTEESPRFDSNAFWYNWSHAGAGAGYYTMARTNGFDSRISFLFSFCTSAVWETFTEWRELIAINDMIFTSFGGPAIGEPLFQVGSYFSHRKGFWNALAGFVTNPFLAVNNWFDHGSGRAANSARDPGWHRFSLHAGLKEDRVSPEGTTAVDHSGGWYRQFNFGLDLETETVPGNGGAENARGYHPETLSSRVVLDTSFSSAGMEEIRIRTSAVLFGGCWPALRRGPDGVLRGHSLSLGYATAFELFKKRSVAWYDSNDEIEGGGHLPAGEARLSRPTPTRFTDKLSVISPAGAVLVLDSYAPPLRLRWTSGIYADFAMVNALPYNRFTEDHDTSGVKSTLLNWGYYYAFGMTLASDAAVDWRQWRARLSASWQSYSSIQGLDRYQYLGYITEDFALCDSRLVGRILVGYRLAGTPLELGLVAEGIARWGALLDLREHCSEYRYYYELRIVF